MMTVIWQYISYLNVLVEEVISLKKSGNFTNCWCLNHCQLSAVSISIAYISFEYPSPWRHMYTVWRHAKGQWKKFTCEQDCALLKCYSQILCGGSTKNFRFWLFCIDLVANGYKTRNTEVELQGPVYFDRTANYLIYYQIR